MKLISKEDKEKLYLQVKHELGYPARKIQVNEEMMDSYFEMALDDYNGFVNEWLIEQQWVSLQGLDLELSDVLTAYSTKSNDFMRSFTYSYSKQVGLGTNAPSGAGWELKRDFITVSGDTQVYVIPANREVNDVLWETPPSIDGGSVDPFSANAWTPSMNGWAYQGRPANYVQPTYTLLLTAQDRRTKQRILQSTLSYKITGGPDGTKLLYLYPVPGTREEINGKFGKHYEGRKVWYFYYDTNNVGRDKCLEENDDTIKLPSDVPTQIMKWDNLNGVARNQVRDLFISRTMINIGRIRGFYSGALGNDALELTMDYRFLFEQGEKLQDATKLRITESLKKLSLVQLTADRAAIATNVNVERGYQPFKKPFISF